MSLFVTLFADLLVAVLLIATIVTSLRLSRRIAGLKADEAAMRQTIGDLVVATSTAERAIVGLRAALDDCDRTLAERLDNAERTCAELALHVQAGEGVLGRIGAIVAQTRVASAAPVREAEPVHAPKPVAARPLAPAPVVSNGERISAALSAAQAISERALERVRARAA